jgi:hypothetical protein
MPNLANEGIAIAPESQCDAGQKPFFWSDDGETNGHALRADTIPCGPFIDDGDRDGVRDGHDNCRTVSNSTQADSDGDGPGDACDVCPFDALNDADGDGTCGDVDNCPDLANDQADADADDLGDACDACPMDAGNDADADGLCGDVDNCPGAPNPDQTDSDADGLGDACDSDDDDDGVSDDADACPGTPHGAIHLNGCSIDQLVPCVLRAPGEWKNHGQYVVAYTRTVIRFLLAGRITPAEAIALVAAAARSTCGR